MSPLRASRRSVAALIAVVVLLAPSIVTGADMRRGAGQYTSSATYEGVDGYIRQGGIVMPNCSGHFVLSWLDIDRRGGPYGNFAWVQIGMHQGSFMSPANCTQVRMYAELNDCGNTIPGVWYWKKDMGVPATPNYPVYVNRTGQTTTVPCPAMGISTVYEYAFRVGSFTSSPKFYGLISAASGNANAQQEVFWNNGSPDNINTNKWGLNHQGQPQSGYQLSLYQYPAQTWSSWSSGVSTSTFSDPALIRYQPSDWRYLRFQVHD